MTTTPATKTDANVEPAESDLGRKPFIPNAVTIAAMEESCRGNVQSFDSVEALMDSLNSEDDE